MKMYEKDSFFLSFPTFQIVRKRVLSDCNEDRDTEEALKEFDFLVASDEGDGESRSSGDGTDWGKEI